MDELHYDEPWHHYERKPRMATDSITTSKPYHQHDCSKCKYLGSMYMDRPMDWYVCGNDSILARFSDEGRDYWSMMPSMVTDDKYLRSSHEGRIIVSGMMVLARHMLTRAK